jgi:hypothetical protein
MNIDHLRKLTKRQVYEAIQDGAIGLEMFGRWCLLLQGFEEQAQSDQGVDLMRPELAPTVELRVYDADGNVVSQHTRQMTAQEFEDWLKPAVQGPEG